MKRLVRAVGVVVREGLLQHRGEVAWSGDQEVVEAFAAQGAGEAFRDGVRSWCSNRGAADADRGAGEHCVEGGGELAVRVADQEPKLGGAVAEIREEVAGLLSDPGSGWVGNRLFTAITRSKAWVRVSGVGSAMQALGFEFDRVKANDFELRFRYPTVPELQELQILHRDMTEGETEVVETERAALDRLIGNLESGRVFKEDLSPDRLAKLRELLGGSGE